MRPMLSLILVCAVLAACAGPTITGPSNLYDPPARGWSKAEVQAHWGFPHRVSTYGIAETWLYRRSYFVTTGYGNVIEAEYASVSFIDGHVVGVAY